MSTEAVAKKVVELVRKQDWYKALDTLYDDNIVSVEAFSVGGGPTETRGKEGVRGKVDWWVNEMEVHSFSASDPFVAHDTGQRFDHFFCMLQVILLDVTLISRL